AIDHEIGGGPVAIHHPEHPLDLLGLELRVILRSRRNLEQAVAVRGPAGCCGRRGAEPGQRHGASSSRGYDSGCGAPASRSIWAAAWTDTTTRQEPMVPRRASASR